MEESTSPIIKHIPLFLDYCKEMGLSEKTSENYKRYLNKFILWLEKKNKNTLLPQELTIDDINEYRLYLASCRDNNGRQSLKPISQNYYLIALRAFLGYFSLKDILCLSFNKITLLGGFKAEKTSKFLNLEQIKQLLLAPDVKTQKGLRDKAILETLVSTGLKVNQLVKLDRDQLEDIKEEVLPLLKEYLKTRKDKNNALFINYRARRSSAGARLTARSVERIVKYYGRKTNLPSGGL